MKIDDAGAERLRDWCKEIEALADRQEDEAKEKMQSAAAWCFIAKAVKAALGPRQK